MIDYYVRLVPFPATVEGAVVPNNDGSFDIYINEALSEERRRQTLEHELSHLRREHFYLDIPIDRIERQADGEYINEVLHPPKGKLPCFHSEAAFAHWLSTLSSQLHIDLNRL